jgi:hypothetical protein
MSTDRQSIRPLLVKNALEQMRQCACDECREKNVVACRPHLRTVVARQQPPTRRERASAPQVSTPATCSM